MRRRHWTMSDHIGVTSAANESRSSVKKTSPAPKHSTAKMLPESGKSSQGSRIDNGSEEASSTSTESFLLANQNETLCVSIFIWFKWKTMSCEPLAMALPLQIVDLQVTRFGLHSLERKVIWEKSIESFAFCVTLAESLQVTYDFSYSLVNSSRSSLTTAHIVLGLH